MPSTMALAWVAKGPATAVGATAVGTAGVAATSARDEIVGSGRAAATGWLVWSSAAVVVSTRETATCACAGSTPGWPLPSSMSSAPDSMPLPVAGIAFAAGSLMLVCAAATSTSAGARAAATTISPAGGGAGAAAALNASGAGPAGAAAGAPALGAVMADSRSAGGMFRAGAATAGGWLARGIGSAAAIGCFCQHDGRRCTSWLRSCGLLAIGGHIRLIWFCLCKVWLCALSLFWRRIR